MKSLILVRHAEAEHITKKLKGGWTDTQLTSKGRRQAVLVAKRLAGDLDGRCVQIYSSDLVRAYDTALDVADALKLELGVIRDLREIDIGKATGMTNAEAELIYNPPTDPILDWEAYPGSETWREFHARVTRCLDELLRDVKDVAVIVSHSGTIVNIVNWWLQLDMDDVARLSYRTHPAGITVLGISNLGERTVDRLNDVCHLVSDGISQEYENLIKPVT